jgi:hypothetical protein
VKWRSEVPALLAAMITTLPLSAWTCGLDSASGASSAFIDTVGTVPGGPE